MNCSHSSSIVDIYKDKIIIFAKLTKGVFPVTSANVVARIFRPGNQSGNSSETGNILLTLRDNGSGDPDVTSGDGIYSAYFSDFAAVPGYYSVQVTADDNKGQARTPKVVPKNVQAQRSVASNQGKKYIDGSQSVPDKTFRVLTAVNDVYVIYLKFM